MDEAIRPHLYRYESGDFITPMVAVAGSVADYILDAMGGGLDRAIVNNGGDIALHLKREPFLILVSLMIEMCVSATLPKKRVENSQAICH